MRSLIIEILLFDPACLYYSDEWSFTVLLVMSSRTSVYSDHRSFVCGHDARNEGGQTKERERAMESKQRHTTSPRRGAWRYLPGPRVCGSRNGNRSSSILAVTFEDRYTLQSVVTVGGPFALYFPDESKVLLWHVVSFGLFTESCISLELR